MTKHFITFVVLLLLLLSACTTPAADQPESTAQNGDASKPALTAFTALNRDKYTTYSSKFLVQFDGPKGWKYQLQTRKSTIMQEYRLHMEGLEPAENPGDIRLLTDGANSWMIGPGTDEECVQFPNNQGMDPTLLTPDMLVTENDLASLLAYVGEESVAGIASLHFAGSVPAIGDWKEARIDVWQDKPTRGLLRFTMQASGNDPFFGKGAGKLTANYDASALDVEAIAPVEGCEISVPLPDTASMFVRLPGMASFDSSAEPEEIRNFYQTELPKGGWNEKDPPQQSEGVVILSYQRNEEVVEIQIRTVSGGGTEVKMIFMQAQ